MVCFLEKLTLQATTEAILFILITSHNIIQSKVYHRLSHAPGLTNGIYKISIWFIIQACDSSILSSSCCMANSVQEVYNRCGKLCLKNGKGKSDYTKRKGNIMNVSESHMRAHTHTEIENTQWIICNIHHDIKYMRDKNHVVHIFLTHWSNGLICSIVRRSWKWDLYDIWGRTHKTPWYFVQTILEHPDHDEPYGSSIGWPIKQG